MCWPKAPDTAPDAPTLDALVYILTEGLADIERSELDEAESLDGITQRLQRVAASARESK